MFMLASILILAIFTTYPSEHHCCHCHLVTCHAVAVLWYVCSFASLYSCVIEMLQIIYIHVYNRLYDYIYIFMFNHKYVCIWIYTYRSNVIPTPQYLGSTNICQKNARQKILGQVAPWMHLGGVKQQQTTTTFFRLMTQVVPPVVRDFQGIACLRMCSSLAGAETNMMVFKLRVLVTWLDVDLRFLYGMSQHLQSFGILE